MKEKTQEAQVIDALRNNGGFATFRRLNEIVDFSEWTTKTPEASVRRIVQNSKAVFRVRPGLWALEEMRDEVLSLFDLKPGNKKSEEQFSHSYYQGLLVEIGKLQEFATFVPSQNHGHLFLGRRLDEMVDLQQIPAFSYEKLTSRAKNVDVVWFNEREMPCAFYEVEHTTDMKNSLMKFYELQDFHARFFIVADEYRKRLFEETLGASIFAPIRERVNFLCYERVAKRHETLSKTAVVSW